MKRKEEVYQLERSEDGLREELLQMLFTLDLHELQAVMGILTVAYTMAGTENTQAWLEQKKGGHLN